VSPENAVAYLETLCRRHGIRSYDTEQDRRQTIDALRDNPDIIQDFIRRGELNIERVADTEKEKVA
jgi:Tfp pilus assembly ATPase PilU